MIRSYSKEILDSNDGSTVKLGCRHVIALDGYFLKKPYVGEILTAVELLGEDIDMPTGNGLKLISDQHKGLIEAMKDVMPLAEHRQCARHIYEGFRKQYSWVEFKELFYAASKASYPQLIGSKCEAVENGFSECFNSVLLLHVIPAGGNLFEVRNGSETFKVDEHNRTCTCGMWQLLGLPCPHSIVVIFKINKRAEDYIPNCFRKDAYFKAYHQYMTLIGGMTFWPDSSMYSTVLPPKPRTMLGKPRKHRIRAHHERQFPNRVSRAGVEMTCQNCFENGHNRSSCSKAKVIPPAKTGRPKKNVANVELGGDATIHMDESSSQVRQEGVATDNNVGSGGVATDNNVGGIRSANLCDFVTVRCDGATRANVGLGVRKVTSDGSPVARRSGSTSSARGRGRGRGRGKGRGRGGQTLGVRYASLGRWFGIGDDTQKESNDQSTLLTQQSEYNKLQKMEGMQEY
ncbi:pentatricopeptide repeat-containing protein [Tanacetum coccineum]|uniref:Pentatricopeptide repeat-containing protein n=1 Tax=Tanacetum coccineum TaxID=301880 RepID=A0ABQ5C985_9ASTR